MSDLSEDEELYNNDEGKFMLLHQPQNRNRFGRSPGNRFLRSPLIKQNIKNVSFQRCHKGSLIPIQTKLPSNKCHPNRLGYEPRSCHASPLQKNCEFIPSRGCSRSLPNTTHVRSLETPYSEAFRWSDSSSEFESYSCTPHFYKLRNTYSKSIQKPYLAKYPKESAPYVHKTYKIGKNTNLNITMTRPVVGSLLKTRERKKPICQNGRQTNGPYLKKKENHLGLNPVQKGKMKSIMSKKKKKKDSKPTGQIGGVVGMTPPLPPESEGIPTEDESEESFRTFVLDTSMQPSYNPLLGKKPCYQLRNKDLRMSNISSVTCGMQDREQPKNEPSVPLRQKMLPKFLLNTKASSCSYAQTSSTGPRFTSKILIDSTVEHFFNESNGRQIVNGECRMMPTHESASHTRTSLDSFVHVSGVHRDLRNMKTRQLDQNNDDKYSTYKVHTSRLSNSSMNASHSDQSRWPSNLDSSSVQGSAVNLNFFSNIKNSLTRAPFAATPINTQNRRPPSATHVPPPKTSPYRITLSRPPKRSPLKRETLTRLPVAVSAASPKPKKGILKKSRLPMGGLDSMSRNKPMGVTYALPPTSCETDEGASQTSHVTESDSGLEQDLDTQYRPHQDPVNRTPSRTSRVFLQWCPPPEDETDIEVLRGWKQKYEILLELVRSPRRLEAEALAKEVRDLETRRQGLAHQRALLEASLDSPETMGGGLKDQDHTGETTAVRSLYEQAAAVDCLLTALETHIDVLSAAQRVLPKETHDTLHDSGTSGHEPDSLEAIEDVVREGGGGNRVSPCHKGPPAKARGLEGGEAAVLLQLERCAHRQARRALQEATRDKASNLPRRSEEERQEGTTSQNEGDPNTLAALQEPLTSLETASISSSSSDEIAHQMKLQQMTPAQLRLRVLQLEKALLDVGHIDAAKESAQPTTSQMQLEKARDELTLQNFTLKSRLAELTLKIADPAATYQVNNFAKRDYSEVQGVRKRSLVEDDIRGTDMESQSEHDTTSSELRGGARLEWDLVEGAYRDKIADLESRLRDQESEATLKFDRQIRNLEDQLEEAHKKLEATERFFLTKEEECQMNKLDLETLDEENKRLKTQLSDAMTKQQEMEKLALECHRLEDDLSRLSDETRVLAQDLNRERVLRKKYYNQVEEMKGKIRVFCRLRPINELERQSGGDDVTRIDDAFSVTMATSRGAKTFDFDRVFGPNEGQEQVFEDTRALIQSAFDGYNVTLMAYGQTGSGKTHTMLGTDSNPGIAPRTFERIFELAEEAQGRVHLEVSVQMLELYNDRLIDLLRPEGAPECQEKLEIQRDRRGCVQVCGAMRRPVTTAADLLASFRGGVGSRHTSATRMNRSSSRSHLVVMVTLNVTSTQSGAVTTGKVSLVDLAGSERAQKSGVRADALREANAINKSLSALGDVIAALSTQAPFVPYRNSKLTMLLQDSVGGNAKTLVFVNVSPASFNLDETLVSLMYASRIRSVTNQASKNADHKELARLKGIIAKLKRGEPPDEDGTL